VVLLAAFATSTAVIEPLRNAIMAGPFLLLILYVATRDLQFGPGWLGSPALVLAGEVSYAFYLVHALVIVNLAGVFPPGLPSVVLMLAVTVTCALVLHLLIERPCNRWLRDAAPSLALAPVDSPLVSYTTDHVRTMPIGGASAPRLRKRRGRIPAPERS